MNSPCYECLCVPICKNKSYTALIDECSIVYKYVFYTEGGFDYCNENYWAEKESIHKDLQAQWVV